MTSNWIKPSNGLIYSAILMMCLTFAGCDTGFEWMVGVKPMTAPDLDQLTKSGTRLQVLDVGPRDDYIEGHIPGAYWVAYRDFEEVLAQMVPDKMDKKAPLVITCPSGHFSVPAAAKAKGQGFDNVFSLHDGVLNWRQMGFALEKGATRVIEKASCRSAFIPMGKNQQLATVVSGFGLKPAYMLITLLLILSLRGSGTKDKRLIFWGMIAFFAGETFCALNYLFFDGRNDLFDMLHGLGMVLMGAWISWGIAVFWDERILQFTPLKGKCTFHRLCGACWKYKTAAPCRMQQMFLLVTPVLALTSLIPWCIPLRSLYRISNVFDTPVLYSYSVELQMVDFRLYALLAVILFLAAWGITFKGVLSLKSAHIPFFTGIGLMSFSIFRFFLLEAFRLSPAWMDFWEEATELFLILAVAWFLYLYRFEIGLRPFATKS